MDVSIVLVDNEPKFLVAYERLLRGLGCTTFCALRLSDAIPYVLSPHVALVVVEPRLVDGDGLELIRMARRTRPPGSGIVITAFPSQVGARQAGEAGAAWVPCEAVLQSGVRRARPGTGRDVARRLLRIAG